MADVESPWETESNWDTERVSPRNKVLWLIVQLVKQGVSENQLRKELAEFIKINHFNEFQNAIVNIKK